MTSTRRHFLATTAVAGLSALASGRRLRAAESPSEQVRLAVIGTGGRGTALARRFAELPGSRLAAVCDVDERARQKALAAVAEVASEAPASVGDFRKLLDDRSIDAVVVATPDHWHASATILACAAGKHVYVEKPASHNPQEGEWMVAAARKHKRLVQLGTQYRSKPAIREAVEKVHSGEIGRTLLARCRFYRARNTIGHGKTVAVPEGLDYSLWQGPAPEMPYRDNVIPYNWHWFWHWGTGELGNNGVHSLDVCRWAVQVDCPTAASSIGGHYRYEDDQETPDTNIVSFQFADKVITWDGRSWYNRRPDEPDYDVSIHGEKGTMTIGSRNYRLYDMAGKELARREGEGSEVPHLENFLDAIRERAKLNAEIDEGVKSTLLCHLGNISWRTGRTVRLDPATRDILGDPDAKALWRREYRPGWEPPV